MPRRAWIVCLVLVLAAGVVTVVVAPRADRRERDGMSLPQAAVLGVVEGLTEYLPVSSTGHLLVAQRAMGIGTADAAGKRAADAFAICIQLGAILAVLGVCFARVRQMARGLLGRDTAGTRLLLHLVVAFVPAAVVGLAAGDVLQEKLFGPWPVVLAWAAGGAAILVVARRRRARAGGGAGCDLDGLNGRAALVIGVAQCVALWPGVSRSLVTIVGGVLVGLSLGSAVEFSFLLGLVTLGAATGYDALRHGRDLLEAYSPAALTVGLCFAFVSAVLAVAWMVAYLRSHGLALFGWYRLGLAAIVALLLWRGVI